MGNLGLNHIAFQIEGGETDSASCTVGSSNMAPRSTTRRTTA